MKLYACESFDETTGDCLAPLWIEATELAGDPAPWLSVEGALAIAGATLVLWASAWAIRAVAHQIANYVR